MFAAIILLGFLSLASTIFGRAASDDRADQPSVDTWYVGAFASFAGAFFLTSPYVAGMF